MSFSFFLLIFLIGFIGSFLSGLVGIGGSIIKYPMLLYIPPLLGFASFTAHEVAGINAIQVLFASLAGALAFRKGGYLNQSLIFYMGTGILIGSFLGGYVSNFLPEQGIHFVYGMLATLAAVMMFLPKKNDDDNVYESIAFNKTLASTLSAIVGFGAGIVGAAGAFLLVPIMLVILKIPTRMTIATSLVITFISSIGTAVSKITTGQVLFWPSVIMVIASVIASPLGANVGKKMNTKGLQWILAILIFATAAKIWFDLF